MKKLFQILIAFILVTTIVLSFLSYSKKDKNIENIQKSNLLLKTMTDEGDLIFKDTLTQKEYIGLKDSVGTFILKEIK